MWLIELVLGEADEQLEEPEEETSRLIPVVVVVVAHLPRPVLDGRTAGLSEIPARYCVTLANRV
jgi:hypothetical protein